MHSTALLQENTKKPIQHPSGKIHVDLTVSISKCRGKSARAGRACSDVPQVSSSASTDVLTLDFLRCGGIFSFKLKCTTLLGESKLPVPHCERTNIFFKCDKLKKKKAVKKTNQTKQDVVKRDLQWSLDFKSILCAKFVNTSPLGKQPHNVQCFYASSIL